MGTFVDIELQARADASSLNTWITAGFDAMSQVDQWMSVYRSDSDVSRLNAAAIGEWVDVHPETAQVLRAALSLYDVSQGLFDIRCGPTPENVPPFRLVGSQVQKLSSADMDLGGIAKGFAVDQAVEAIQRLTGGYRVSGSVNAGGDMRLWGCGQVPAAAQIQGQGSFWLRPFVIQETAAATSSVRTPSDTHLAPAIHRYMPSGRICETPQTVTVFARRCLWADALTKVVLTASDRIARACLASYQAKALVFNPHGALQTVMG